VTRLAALARDISLVLAGADGSMEIVVRALL
jgi:hypothetical protein